jgi:ABC-type spermidine/putrescine transport systems, ATPase components
VALARALAPRPGVLLLDEPLSALDALTRTVLRDEIRRIQLALGTTALYVTHDQAEALAVADRIGVMEGGQIVELGPPAEIYRNPRSRFGAAFLGGRNALALTIGEDGWVRCGDAFALPVPDGRPGSQVFATFPPESVFFADDAGLGGRILLVSFRGALTRFRVETEQGEIDADLLSMAAPVLRRGESVHLRVHAALIRLYPVDRAERCVSGDQKARRRRTTLPQICSGGGVRRRRRASGATAGCPPPTTVRQGRVVALPWLARVRIAVPRPKTRPGVVQAAK